MTKGTNPCVDRALAQILWNMDVPLLALPCWLVALPDELKLHIVNYVSTREDLEDRADWPG